MMKQMCKRMLAMMLTCIMVFGMLPAVGMAAAEEAVQPIVIDFKQTAREAAEQPWWDTFATVSLENGGTSKRVGSYVNQPMTAQEKEAYAAMQEWMEETQPWQIVESDTKLISYNGNRLYLCPDDSTPWGICYNPYYRDTQLAMEIQVEAAGWYHMELDVMLLNGNSTDWPVENTYGFTYTGWSDIIVNGKTVYPQFNFRGSTREVRSLGAVYLEEGVNTVHIKSVKSYDGSTTATPFSHTNLCSMTFSPMEPVQVVETGTKTIDLSESWLAYDEGLTYDHLIEIDDPSIVSASLNDAGHLVLEGRKVGATRIVITEKGETVCLLDVEVAPRSVESLQPIVIDFKAMARQAQLQPWWDELYAGQTMNGAETRRIGNTYNQTMTAQEHAAYQQMLAWLEENEVWNISVGGWDANNRYSGNRGFLCPDKNVDWGFLFNAYFIDYGETSNLNLTVEAKNAGWYSLGMDVSLQSTSAQDYPDDAGFGAGGGYMDVLVNGSLVREDEFLSGSGISHRNMGKIYLKEGENTITIASVGNVFGNSTPNGGAYSSRANICLKQIELVPLGLHLIPKGSAVRMDVKQMHLPYDADLTDVQLVVDDEDVVSATLDENGILEIEAKAVGTTELVLMRTGIIVCSFAIRVTEEAVETDGETVTVSKDGWYRPQLRYDCDLNGTMLEVSLDGALLGTVDALAAERSVQTKTLPAVYLTAGEHTLDIASEAELPRSVTFTACEEPALTLSARQSLTMKKGRSMTTAIAGRWDNGLEEELIGAKWQVEVSDEAVLQAQLQEATAEQFPVLTVTGLQPEQDAWVRLTAEVCGTQAEVTVPVTVLEPAVAVTMDASLKGVKDGQIPRGSLQNFDFTMADEDGEAVYPAEVEIAYTCRPEGIVEIDTHDHTLQALQNGEVTVDITVTSGENVLKKTLELTVADTGANLLDDDSSYFENGSTGSWTGFQKFGTPDITGWSEVMDDGTGNMAIKIQKNPDTRFNGFTGVYLNLAYGKYVKVEPGHMYELSFRVKIDEYENAPEAASFLRFIAQGYDYKTSYGGTSINEMSVTKNVPTDKLGEWFTFTLPVRAPIGGEDSYYIMPVISVQPNFPGEQALSGWKLTAWIDDYEIREVGFGDIRTSLAEPLTTVDQVTNLIIEPLTTTGTVIRLDDASEVRVSSTDPDVVDVCGDIVLAANAANDNVPNIPVTLVGLNAPCDLNTTVTIHGVTKTVAHDVTTSGMKEVLRDVTYTLDGFEAITMSHGDTAKGDVTARTTQLTPLTEEQLRSQGTIYFKTGDKTVVTVDQATGDVCAVGEGKTQITVYSQIDGMTRSDTIPVVVTDDTDLASVSLRSNTSYVGVGNTMQMYVDGLKSSGSKADMELYPVAFSLDDEEGAIAIITDDGKLTGVKPGTVTVTATAAVDGKAVSGSVTVEVVGNDLLPGEDILMDFTDGKALKMETATIEADGMEINRELTYHGGAKVAYNIKGGLWVQSMTVGDLFVIDFVVTRDGWYAPSMQSSLLNYGGHAKLFLDDTYIGFMDFNQGKSEWYAGKGAYNTVYLEAGVHSLIFECTKNGYIFPGKLWFYANPSPYEMEVTASAKEDLLIGESTSLEMVIDAADGRAFTLDPVDAHQDYNNYYLLESSDPGVVSVSGKTVTGVAVGTATVTAYANVDGRKLQRQVEITVSEGVVHALELKAEQTTLKPDAGTVLGLTAYDMDGNTLEALPEGVTVTYTSGDTSIATVDAEGHVTLTGKEGSVQFTVTVVENGREVTAAEWVVVTVGKTEPTIYTWEERAIAQENVLKYDWAWQEKETAVKKADYVLEHFDEFYEMIIHEGIPRNASVGLYNDPDMYTCRYCGVYLAENHTVYPWLVDPINKPWKITCPECKRDFPSNDFGAYYESGLDETGRFRYELADDSLLVNELYPEMGEGWGVDNGQGYVTGNVYSNGAKEVHTYIAYYMHCVYSALGESKNDLKASMNALRDAYLYTGDEKYGNAGAILLDRFADIYPEADYYLYEKRLLGKLIQAIWESQSMAQMLATCADAFWPCMEDEEVLTHIRDNAWRKAIDPEAVTPDYLRSKIDENILLEIKKGCETTDLFGNFGFHQAAMAYAAVALDRMPETEEMLDWVFRFGERTGTAGDLKLDGGSLLYNLVQNFDRDGFGGDGSPAYNQLWYRNLDKVADALENYDKVEGANLWENPRFYNQFHSFIKLTRMGTAAVCNGEAGQIQSYGTYPELSYLIRAFSKTGDREIARALYQENGNSVQGIHADIFTKDPESGLRAAVQKIVDEDGVWDMSQSEMMAGYGLAIMRSGPESILPGINESKFSDYTLWFGLNGGTHGALEALHISIGAYGLDLTSGMGYPNFVNTEDPERQQFMRNNISRNTVMVDDWAQSEFKTGTAEPLHFEDAGFVKVMDAQAPGAYEQTDIYRRTMVMVQADKEDDISYAVDFFRVLGGSEHLYSFHANTMLQPETDGLDFVHQAMGTYAGADVPLGHHVVNPGSNDATVNMGSGYSWLDDVYRDEAPDTTFSVDFAVQDFNKQLVDGSGIHLKLTMLSEEPLEEVAIASGHPSQKPGNPTYLKFLLARSSGDPGLDTLFTTVIEPYRYENYIASSQLLDVELVEGTPAPHGRTAAIKVTLKDGREDFVVYSTDPDCTYSIKDTDGSEKFRFAGFAGVCSYRDGVLVYAYGNEATIVPGREEKELSALTGTVLDFTKGLAHQSFLTVKFDQSVTEQMLEERYIYIDNHTEQNGAYRIHDAKIEGDTVVLDLNKQSFVLRYIDGTDLDKGFVYNIAEGQTFKVPLSVTHDAVGCFNYTSDLVVKAGNKLNLALGAGTDVTYTADGMTSGMKLDAKTGTLTWTTSRTAVGRYPITMRAVRDGEVVGEMRFTIYVVNYTGSAYAPDKCSHSKTVTYTVDGMVETVCPACGTVTKTAVGAEAEKFSFVGSNMTLGNELKLNCMVDTTDLKDGDYALITHNGETVKADFAKYNSTYSFVSCSVAAKEMADAIEVVVVDKDGREVSTVYTASVRDYAMKALAASTAAAKIRTLVVDMLNYGAAAQTYFGYNEKDLATSKLTAAQKALATGDVSCTDKRVKGENYYGSNLSLEDRIILNLYFKNCTEGMTAKVTYTDYCGRTVTSDAAVEPYSGSICKVVVDEIVLADAFCPVTVTVYNGEKLHGIATDSVESYVARAEGSDLYENIMKFAYAARAYLS
ncbi:MAG: Ig-like domain-containing protein [Oscillospiraceae bacterium]|nr:Ig-like domain-containing protein [Oscillospiraceae bacterium]